jgi:hypothetical protein
MNIVADAFNSLLATKQFMMNKHLYYS